MKALIQFEIPTIPNFLRPQGFKDSISIGQFTDDELREVAREWTDALLERAAIIRKEGVTK